MNIINVTDLDKITDYDNTKDTNNCNKFYLLNINGENFISISSS